MAFVAKGFKFANVFMGVLVLPIEEAMVMVRYLVKLAMGEGVSIGVQVGFSIRGVEVGNSIGVTRSVGVTPSVREAAARASSIFEIKVIVERGVGGKR